MPAGAFIFLKNSVLVFNNPAGAFIFLKNSVLVFSNPAGAFIFLKKCIRGAAGRQGPAGEGKVWFCVEKTILWDTPGYPADPGYPT